MDIKDIKKEQKPISALPNYEVRTMKDDLAEVGLKKLEKEAKTFPAPLPKPEKEEFVPKVKKEAAPPEKLPIAPKKAPLPGTEELIAPEELTLPPSPLEVEELKIPEPTYAPVTPVSKKKIFIFSLIILIVLGVGVGVFFILKGKETPPLPPPPTTTQPSAPLISMNETKIITLLAEKSLFETLKEEAKLDQPIRTFKRIAILKNEKEFLSLVEIFQNLEIPIPPYALTNLKENYNLVLFSQTTGKRLGLLVEIQNPENLKEQLSNWEPTMLDDFKNFYPSQLPGARASQTFLDDIYQEVAIRYVNLPYSTLTLNYTILNNILVIGTSKELMYTSIDKILEK
ncbi:MAG: hypothetical protein ACOZAL_02075 [Patescibacteria group bacterium]